MSSLTDSVIQESDTVGYPVQLKVVNNAVRACYNVVQGQLTNLISSSISWNIKRFRDFNYYCNNKYWSYLNIVIDCFRWIYP